MKLIAYILTLWVLLLSCIPCSDQATTKGAVIQYTAAAGSQHIHIDTCSPFCICACCATSPVLSEQVTWPRCAPELSITHTAFCFSFVEQFPIDVWQPPQLV